MMKIDSFCVSILQSTHKKSCQECTPYYGISRPLNADVDGSVTYIQLRTLSSIYHIVDINWAN